MNARGAFVFALALGLAGCGRPPSEASSGGPPPESAPLPSASVATPSASASVEPIAEDPPPAPIDATAAEALAAGPCEAGAGAQLFASPASPAIDVELRLVGTHAGPPADFVVVKEEGAPAQVLTPARRHGPPSSVVARTTPTKEGALKAVVVREGKPVHCATVQIAKEPKKLAFAGPQALPWAVTAAWSRPMEDLFSAWVEALFDAPDDEFFSVGSLDEITRDEEKNFLHDHLGGAEDAAPPKGMRLDPDCADLPYFLRAYFAWKLGLPFAFSQCSRGGGGQAPRCQERQSNLDPLEEGAPKRWKRFETFARVTLKNTVHSGTGRTLATDDKTDYYPIPLSRETLRPGAIYADPYGHILVVAKIVPQKGERAGALFAVDGQPDGTVAKKRFWEGNFLFMQDEPAMGNPGFKRFRPITARGGNVRALSNDAIAKSADWGDHSLDQSKLDRVTFYEAMDAVLNPTPRDPEAALLAAVGALEEQAKARVTSIENGEKHFRKGGGRIEMPGLRSIFETTGDWENYSTPSRDLRLLIAIDVVTGFPRRVERAPARYRLAAGASPADVARALEQKLASELAKRRFSYVRSDGSSFELSLADVVARAPAFEIAFNPNDCAEVRWGAEPGTSEAATCKRRASAGDQRKMNEARPWLRDRKRPAR